MTIQNDEGEQEIIDSTPQHPFYVEGRGWVEASSLHAGMTIWFANGTKGTVEDISNEGLEEPVTVYNFEVKDFHTYFVGECGALVHNMCAVNESTTLSTPVSDDSSVNGPYANLTDSSSVGVGKKFTATQNKNIIQQNMEKNGGVIKSDLSGTVLVPTTKSQKGVTPSPLEVQIDHIEPRSKGGSNSYSNAQVLSREENRAKSDK